MVADYTFFYIESNIICIIVFMMVIFKEMASPSRQTKQLVFINICFSHVLYYISDIGWVQVLYDFIPRSRLTVSCFNFMNAVMLCLITGYWFVYVELSQGEKYITETKLRIYVLIPAMINTLVMLILFLFFPNVVIDADYNVTTAYYIFFLSVPIFYIVISCIRTFIRAFRRENYAVRGQYLTCGIYPLMISVFGIIQTLWFSAPIFCFATTLMILYVYIVSLTDQVSIDDLTHLNNRTQLKKYIVSEASKPGGDKANRFILMIDLNKFKEINDQYGHVEGAERSGSGGGESPSSVVNIHPITCSTPVLKSLLWFGSVASFSTTITRLLGATGAEAPAAGAAASPARDGDTCTVAAAFVPATVFATGAAAGFTSFASAAFFGTSSSLVGCGSPRPSHHHTPPPIKTTKTTERTQATMRVGTRCPLPFRPPLSLAPLRGLPPSSPLRASAPLRETKSPSFTPIGAMPRAFIWAKHSPREAASTRSSRNAPSAPLYVTVNVMPPS